MEKSDLSRALEETWCWNNKTDEKRPSIRYSDPWILAGTNVGSNVRLSSIQPDDDHDSGLDGPLTHTDVSSDTSSLISLEPVVKTNYFLTHDHVTEVETDEELNFNDGVEGTAAFDFDDRASLDWDYSDNVADQKSDNKSIDEQTTWFEKSENVSHGVSKIATSSTELSAYTKAVSRRSEDSQPGQLWRKRRVVVVATDGSDNGDEALDYYLDRIHKEPYIICLVHCVQVPKMQPCEELPPREYQTMVAECREEASYLVSQYKYRFRQEGIVHSTRIIHSDQPALSILNVAEEVGADFIVVGHRPMSKIRRAVLGGVSDYLVKHAKSRVLVYPPTKKNRFNCCGFPVKKPSLTLPIAATRKKSSADSGDRASLISAV